MLLDAGMPTEPIAPVYVIPEGVASKKLSQPSVFRQAPQGAPEVGQPSPGLGCFPISRMPFPVVRSMLSKPPKASQQLVEMRGRTALIFPLGQGSGYSLSLATSAFRLACPCNRPYRPKGHRGSRRRFRRRWSGAAIWRR
jgi:hypothetical protein